MAQFGFMKGKLSLHLLDVSPKMRSIQCNTLCGYELDVSERDNPQPKTSIYGDINVSWHNKLSM